MKLLILRNEVPWPLHYGGRLHSYELCRRLAERHELLLLAERPCEVSDPALPFACRIAPEDEPADGIRLDRAEEFFGIKPSYIAHVLRVVHQWRPDVVIGGSYRSLACLAHIRGVPKVWDLQDDEILHRLRELRHGRLTNKWTDLKCLAAMWLFQRRRARSVDAITVLSSVDQRFCRYGTGHPRVECVPHGVDSDHYAPSSEAPDPNRIAFWGGLTFGPNISAVLYFAEKVWPLVLKRRPEARWSVIGWGTPPQLEHVRRMRGVEFTGYVDDIRPHVARAAAVVVPMVSGAGIKNKVMESWAMGKPTVCTRRAVGDLPGVHGRNVWLGDSPTELANGILCVLSEPELARGLGEEARRTAVERCSWEQAARRTAAICEELRERARAGVDGMIANIQGATKEALTHAAS